MKDRLPRENLFLGHVDAFWIFLVGEWGGSVCVYLMGSSSGLWAVIGF